MLELKLSKQRLEPEAPRKIQFHTYFSYSFSSSYEQNGIILVLLEILELTICLNLGELLVLLEILVLTMWFNWRESGKMVLKVQCESVTEGTQTLDPWRFTISYDKLVIALGAQPTTFGIHGVYEYAIFLREVYHAQEIRRKLLLNLMMSDVPGLQQF